MALETILGIEALIGLVFLFCLARRPATCGLLAIVLGVAASYGIFSMWSIGPFEKSLGSQITGKEFMKAAIFDPTQEQLVTLHNKVPVPDVSPKHALIEIQAAALNPSNYKLNLAKVPFLRHLRLHVVGYDFAGKVLSVGTDPSCKHLKVGDEVYGLCPSGSFAEFGSCFCRTVAKKPKSLDFKQAASLPVVALTTQEAYVRGKLKKGDNVLVIGASGGCGIFGVTMAKAMGAKVTGICSTKNVDFVKKLGADVVVDYKDAAQMKKLNESGKVFNVIYDTVSSFEAVDPDYEPMVGHLKKAGGQYVAINGYFNDWSRGLVDLFFGIDIHRPGYQLFLLNPDNKMLDALAKSFDSGELKDAPIAKVFKLNAKDVTAAFDMMMSRRTVGKIILDMSK